MKKRTICWTDVVMGFLAASVFWLFIYAVAVVPNITKEPTTKVTSESSVATEQVVEESVKAYETGIQLADFKWENGESVRLNTPKNFYSLTDQYIDSLYEYYGVTMPSTDQMFVVGDTTDTASCNVMINAASLSTADLMLSSIYSDEYDSSTDLYSEVYTYMTTGSLPEELPDDYYLCDYGTVVVDGVSYHVYDKYYTMTYTYYDEEDTAQVSPQTLEVPNYEFVAYSDTEDPVEIITFLVDYDVQKAYNYLCEFIGVEATDLPEGTVICGEAPIKESGDITNE